MEVSYQLEVEDFRQGILAYRKKSAFLRWGIRLGAAFAIFLICLGIVLLALRPQSSTFLNLRPLFVLCVFWLILLWGSPYLSARQQLRGYPSAKAPIKLEVSDSGLHFQSEYADSRLSWPSFVTWVEEKTVFALFTNRRLFIPIPRRAFSVEQLVQFREMLRGKIQAERR
jgi:YcxB-like protein